MMRNLIPLCLILTACDPAPPPTPETETQPSPVFESQIQSLEKARAVNAQAMEAAEAQRKQLDEAAGQ
jgi:hypothetical protein